MKIKNRLLAFLLVICTLVSLIPISALTAFATENTKEKEDASVDIKTGLESYIQGETQSFTDDGYIGIPYEITVYYDSSKGKTVTGYNGTPVILYVINSGAERIGTESDVNIITDMLTRGYAVAVLDYKNNAKAVSPGLEFSAQKIREKLKNGDFFTNKTVFPSGTYYENHVVPAGHNVSLGNVFYEIDKHGADGVLEKIVEQWNVDFRGCHRDVIIKWTDENGNRKTTQNGFDGSAPVWYSDVAGKNVDNVSGEYVKLQYTKAMKITDCVKKDGTLIDFNLYMHIVYPTSPESDVPVMVLSGSSEHLASGMATANRPYLVRYSMSGYAVAAFDFEYIPMARNDHYTVFNGLQAGGITGTDGTFGLGQFIRSNYQTAAIRYLRYLSLSQHSTFAFDNNRVGIYGNSKGGFQTFLGAAALKESKTAADFGGDENALISYIDNKVTHFFTEAYITATDSVSGSKVSFDGDSRYQNGKTETAAVGNAAVDGGTLQPWLTYRGEDGVLREIPSGVQFVYSSCGGTASQEWEGHSPVFTASNYYDNFGSGYSTHNYLENCLRIYDIPSLYFEAPLEHDLVSGLDVNHGVDTYEALFKFTDYYLKDAPTSIVYTDPIGGDAGVKTTDGITLRFYGPVTAEEIAKITVKDASGNAAIGEWVSGYGKTQWTFNPKALNGGVKYTVTVPSSLKGDNGVETGADFSFSFYTENESSADFNLSEPVKVTKENGTYFAFTAPESLTAPLSRLKLRFKVANAAANVAEIYKASSETDTAGALIGSVNVSGAGYYEYDVTDYVMSGGAGETVYFRVKAGKAAADTVTYTHNLDSTGDLKLSRVTSSLVTEVDGESVTALKLINTNYNGWYPVILENSKIINGGSAVTKADYGRSFTVKLRVYDTASRPLQLWFNDCTDGSKTTNDFSYSRTVTHTVANEWIEVTVPYTVYEMDYGIQEQAKTLKLVAYSTGSTEMPLYIDSLTVTEHVTDIEITEASLVFAALGSGEYKAPVSEKAFEVNGTEYATWAEAVAAVGTVSNSLFAENPALATVKLNRDYTFGEGDAAVTLSAIQNLAVDLSGYVMTLADASLLSFASENATTVNVTVKNGTVIIEGAPLVSYAKASAAGNGRIYNVSFENVYIAVGDNATVTEVISASTSPAGASVTQSLNFTDCTFDINRKALPKTPVKVFPQGEDNLDTKYSFNGGEIRVSSFVKLSLSENVFDFLFEDDGSGEFTAIVTPEAVSVDPEMTVMSSKGYSYFTLSSAADGYKTYKITGSKYTTPYGIVPDDKSPEDYPFAVFMNGELLGVYNAFAMKDASGNALDKVWANGIGRGEHNKEIQVVLRRDYDATNGDTLDTAFENICQIGGTLVIDLGSYTFKLKNSMPLIYNYGKYGWDAAENKNHVYDSKIIVNGGTIIAADTPIVKYESSISTTATALERYNKKKITDMVFDGTTFVSSVPIIGAVNKSNVNKEFGAELNVAFNGCEFDVSGVSSAVTLFDGYDSISGNDLNVTVNGGNITASSLDNVTLYKLDNEDRFTFGKDSTGDYTTLTAPSSYTVPTVGGVNDEGKCVAFGSGKVSGENTVYSLSESDLVTKYGIIPSNYANATAYPFVLFKNGECIGAYNVFCSNSSTNNVLDTIRNVMQRQTDDTVYVVMRRSYAMSEAANSIYWNWSHLGGNVIFDLGENTLTVGNDPFMVWWCKAGWNSTSGDHVFTSNVSFICGKIVSKSAPIIKYYSQTGTKYNTAKLVGVTFEKTSFVLGNKGFTETTEEANPTYHAAMELILNNCNIDITAATEAVTLFDGADSTKMNRLSVTLSGGSIKTSDASKLTLFGLDSSDSIIFKKLNDVYPELKAVSGAAPSVAIPTDEGTMYFSKYSSDSSGTVYHLSKKTEYGLIPYDYTPEEYPFAVFYNRQLISVHKIWCQDNTASALYAARALTVGNAGSGKTIQILMRRDYTMSAADNNYGNLAHLGGTLIIDLGDYTFTSASGKPFLATKAQTVGDSSGTYVCDTTIIVKGGKINTQNQAPIVITTNVFESRFENYTRAKIFDITFEGTEFIIPSGGKGIIDAGSSNHENGAIFNVTFNNCKFNVETASNINIFSGSDSDGNSRNVLNLTVNGGKITAANMDKVTISRLDAKDTLVFGKYNGAYVTLTINAGSVPTAEYVTTEGDKVIFASTGTEGEYTLTKACSHPNRKDCSTKCDSCGKVFEDVAEHTYDSDYPSCDGDCNVCGETREVTHNYLYTYSDTEHRKQCECGAIDESTRGAHTEGSRCYICGRKADGVTALYGNNLVLGSDVLVAFNLEIDILKAEGAIVEIGLDRDYALGKTVKIPVSELETLEIDGNTYYMVTYAVSGKDIYSGITARLIRADGTYGTEYVYSAAKYAQDAQNVPTDDVYTEELKALANALLVYGRNAAAVLAGGEAAETITDVSFDLVSDVNGSADRNEVIKLQKFSLELKSNIKLKVYFTFDPITAASKDILFEDYTATAGEEAAKINSVGGNVYCVEYQIVASKLGEDVTFSIEDSDGKGLSLTFSALSYAKIVNASDKTSAAEKNLMKAIKLYNEAAVAYAATLPN